MVEVFLQTCDAGGASSCPLFSPLLDEMGISGRGSPNLGNVRSDGMQDLIKTGLIFSLFSVAQSFHCNPG